MDSNDFIVKRLHGAHARVDYTTTREVFVIPVKLDLSHVITVVQNDPNRLRFTRFSNFVHCCYTVYYMRSVRRIRIGAMHDMRYKFKIKSFGKIINDTYKNKLFKLNFKIGFV